MEKKSWRVVQQRFALLWGPGAYDVYNAKMQKNAKKPKNRVAQITL